MSCEAANQVAKEKVLKGDFVLLEICNMYMY